MNPLSQHRVHQHAKMRQTKATGLKQLIVFGEKYRFGISCFMLIIAECLSCIIALYGATHSTAMFVIAVLSAIIMVALLLAAAPMRLIYIAFGLTLTTDLFILLGLHL
ncbi:MAG: hypothetical protein V4604_11030 [Bacteroidota bacterium]